MQTPTLCTQMRVGRHTGVGAGTDPASGIEIIRATSGDELSTSSRFPA